MPYGPGRYDHVCTMAREASKAVGTLLIVLGGEHGDGFSCQAPIEVMASLPKILEDTAQQIRAEFTAFSGGAFSGPTNGPDRD